MTLSQQQLDFDSKHIWHPYTNLKHPTPVFGVESAQGVYLNLSDGRRIIDGMSSWWSTIHGYNHPKLNQAIEEQVKNMAHVMFGGLTHKPAIDLCERLLDITAEELSCIFLADSGSVSVEVGLKKALQYWYSLGKKDKNKFVAFKHAYHGDTFGAMAVCDPENGMHSMFKGVLPQHFFVSSPSCRRDEDWTEENIAEFRACLQNNHQVIAAVILEPLVQGAGGMRFYCPEYLRQVRQICDQYDVLLILDEIATGFGRTGTLFAYQQANVVPDILCVGKALTGGYLSLAATLCKQKIADAISDFDGGNLMHGPTFMANPMACAVANASLELLLSSNWQQKIQQIESQLVSELQPCEGMNKVADVRVKGAIGVIELTEPVDIHLIQPRLVELGVWIRPFGKLIYIMPPYVIEPEQLTELTKAMCQITRELSR